jgi:hypothetical protein
VSATQLTAEALPPALFQATMLSRLWRENSQIREPDLAKVEGYKEFAEREAAREAKKLDQRRGETGGVTFNQGKCSHGRSSHSDTTLYIPLVFIYTKYAGWCRNDFNVYA